MYRHVYRPERGMFCALADERPTIGAYHEEDPEPIACGLLEGGAGVVLEGVEYRLGDALFVHHSIFAKEESESEGESDEEEGKGKTKVRERW